MNIVIALALQRSPTKSTPSKLIYTVCCITRESTNDAYKLINVLHLKDENPIDERAVKPDGRHGNAYHLVTTWSRCGVHIEAKSLL